MNVGLTCNPRKINRAGMAACILESFVIRILDDSTYEEVKSKLMRAGVDVLRWCIK